MKKKRGEEKSEERGKIIESELMIFKSMFRFLKTDLMEIKQIFLVENCYGSDFLAFQIPFSRGKGLFF
jgi:hypothetical protein